MRIEGSYKTRRKPKLRGVQSWLVGLLGTFLALVIISAGLTFRELQAQGYAAQVINLAGRQRMLIQQMAGLSLRNNGVGMGEDSTGLASTANSFEQTLLALQNGGSVVEVSGKAVFIKPADDPQVITELDQLADMWEGYRPQISLMSQGGSQAAGSLAQNIQDATPGLIAQAERVVKAYEEESNARVVRLRQVQLGFLCSGLALLIISGWAARKWVIQPLDQLNSFARQVGSGQFDHPVTIDGPEEIRVLGDSMENMRKQLQKSQGELKQWIDLLEDRVHKRTETLEALATVSQEIVSHLSIDDVLRSVTDKAKQLLGSDVALLCLLDKEKQNLKLNALTGADQAILNITTPVRENSTGQILGSSCAVPCGADACPGLCQILAPSFRNSHIAAPLRIGDRVIGALCIGSVRADAFQPESMQALSQLTNIAAVALENSRVYAQVERITALEERQRIASDMHDGLLQTLSFLRWMVRMSGEHLFKGDFSKALETYQQIERAVDQADVEIRQAIASLQENFSVQYTLQEQLEDMVSDTQSFHLPVKWENKVNTPVVLPRTSAEQILRVAREALLNAQKHSQADKVIMRFEKNANELVLSIIDNGVGFSFEATPVVESAGSYQAGKEQPHFGLKIMQARAARLHGRIEIESSPGEGTRAVLHWPAPDAVPELVGPV
jgi:two-component system nitrate/nitrite sensor histidine kinase NarX